MYSCLENAYVVEHYANLEEIHGTIRDMDMASEINEQHLIFKHLPRNAKVLELGGNEGRASMIITKLLKNPSHHVVLESDPVIAEKLEHNKRKNRGKFHVVNAALSEKPMMQKEWVVQELTTPTPPEGWTIVPTITYRELQKKHPIPFDTLVVDCEGCLGPIFRSYPQILRTVRTIIIENDAVFISHDLNEEIKSFLTKNKFRCVESWHTGFYEVWKR
jgi:FkbM family methyltransferase